MQQDKVQGRNDYNLF